MEGKKDVLWETWKWRISYYKVAQVLGQHSFAAKQSHSAMRRNTDPFSRHLQIAIFEFQKFSFSKWG